MAVSNGRIASWFKETLTLSNIRALGGSTRKAAVTYAASAHTSTMYWHDIGCLPTEVLVKILEQTLASIQGVNVPKIATDSPH